jgi:hypothetical protein
MKGKKEEEKKVESVKHSRASSTQNIPFIPPKIVERFKNEDVSFDCIINRQIEKYPSSRIV